MLSRRSLLRRLTAAPLAAIATFPLLQAAAAFVPTAEEDGAATLTTIEAGVPQTLEAVVPVAEPGVVYPSWTVFDEGQVFAQQGRFLLRQAGPDFVRHVALSMHQVLVRGADGVVRHWALP